RPESTIAPRTREDKIATIWRAVLGVDTLGVHDSFFELGGHSLLAMRMMSLVSEAFRVELPLRALFEAPTIAQLSQLVARAQAGGPAVPDDAKPLDPSRSHAARTREARERRARELERQKRLRGNLRRN